MPLRVAVVVDCRLDPTLGLGVRSGAHFWD